MMSGRKGLVPGAQHHRQCHPQARMRGAGHFYLRRRLVQKLTSPIAELGKLGMVVRYKSTERTSNAVLACCGNV